MSLSRRDTASGRCEGAFAATEESLSYKMEILRFAQDDIYWNEKNTGIDLCFLFLQLLFCFDHLSCHLHQLMCGA
jgi:hypothetical protein